MKNKEQITYATFYDILAPFGITPDSTMEQIREVSFDLMEQPDGMTKTQRHAWDGLRKIETRLVADFLYWRPGGHQKVKHKEVYDG